MIDSCGSAGGRFPGQPTGGAGAQFQNSSLAKEGDRGSKLPAMPAQAVWKAGASYEVGWTVAANHGGGYAYRLAPADEPLVEATFQKMALDFVGNSILRECCAHALARNEYAPHAAQAQGKAQE